jgi:hypothetical protein
MLWRMTQYFIHCSIELLFKNTSDKQKKHQILILVLLSYKHMKHCQTTTGTFVNITQK